MKKCNIYLDYVNSENFDENDSVAFNDVLIHSEHCTDCSFDRKIREKMLKSLSSYSEPDYPENLHEITMSNNFDNRARIYDEPNLISKLFIDFLKPLEIGFSFACIIMLFFFIQLNSNTDENINSNRDYSEVSSLNKIKIAEANDNINDDGLQKVSSEEVKEFLTKLEEFQKLHPESKTKFSNRANIRLVNDKR